MFKCFSFVEYMVALLFVPLSSLITDFRCNVLKFVKLTQIFQRRIQGLTKTFKEVLFYFNVKHKFFSVKVLRKRPVS